MERWEKEEKGRMGGGGATSWDVSGRKERLKVWFDKWEIQRNKVRQGNGKSAVLKKSVGPEILMVRKVGTQTR